MEIKAIEPKLDFVLHCTVINADGTESHKIDFHILPEESSGADSSPEATGQASPSE